MVETASVLSDEPMEKVTVSQGVQGGAEISFSPKLDLKFSAPWTFEVQVNRTPANDSGWEEVADLGDANWSVLDLERYRFDLIAEMWYRVVLIDADSVRHPSRAVQPGNTFARHDFIIAREICRQAYQEMRLGSGSLGYLFRKRDWGALCDNCGDDVTQGPRNSQCGTCLGTGYVGGYYEPYLFILGKNVPTRRLRQSQTEGFRDDTMAACKAVNFPVLHPGDIWVEQSSGRRWAVQDDIQSLAAVRDVPVTIQFSMHAIETTDVTYEHLQTPEEEANSLPIGS